MYNSLYLYIITKVYIELLFQKNIKDYMYNILELY